MRSTLDRHRINTPGEGRWLALAVMTLGAGLGLNTVLGPLVTDTIRYPFSQSLRNQTIGLEAVTLLFVAPLCTLSGLLIWRGRRAGPVLAFGPAAYAAYMFLQYVVGPGYTYYPRILPLHLGLFILSGMVGIGAWSAIDVDALPVMTERVARRHANVLLLCAAFIVLRYLPAVLGSWSQDAIATEFASEPGMFWSILALDLGIVVPASVYASAALRSNNPASAKSLYAVLGWFALVPPSVAAMALVMVLNRDPNSSLVATGVFLTGAAVFSVYAVRVFLPLLRGEVVASRGGRPRGPVHSS